MSDSGIDSRPSSMQGDQLKLPEYSGSGPRHLARSVGKVLNNNFAINFLATNYNRSVDAAAEIIDISAAAGVGVGEAVIEIAPFFKSRSVEVSETSEKLSLGKRARNLGRRAIKGVIDIPYKMTTLKSDRPDYDPDSQKVNTVGHPVVEGLGIGILLMSQGLGMSSDRIRDLRIRREQ